MAVTLDCCGIPMNYREVLGIRVYDCVLRNHPRVYVKGDQVIREEDLDVHHQDEVQP
jgi:hypothetical protein